VNPLGSSPVSPDDVFSFRRAGPPMTIARHPRALPRPHRGSARGRKASRRAASCGRRSRLGQDVSTYPIVRRAINILLLGRAEPQQPSSSRSAPSPDLLPFVGAPLHPTIRLRFLSQSGTSGDSRRIDVTEPPEKSERFTRKPFLALGSVRTRHRHLSRRENKAQGNTHKPLHGDEPKPGHLHKLNRLHVCELLEE
jgi:hypothetical protein